MLKKLKAIIVDLEMYIFSAINLIIPKSRNNVVFSFSTDDLSENARVVFDGFVKLGLNKSYNITCLVHDASKYKDDNTAKFYNIYSLRGSWAYFRAKYVIYATGLYGTYFKSKNQVCVNIWHGMTIKKILCEVFPDNKKEQKRIRPNHAVATSDFFSEIMARSFGIDKNDVFVTGYPRNDQLFCNKDVLRTFGIDKSQFKKVFLWMPTYRKTTKDRVQCNGDDIPYGAPFLTKETRLLLNEKLKEKNCLMIIKVHNMQEITDDLKEKFSNIILINKDDLSEKKVPLYYLVGQCDVLLTDYSSIFVDYLLLDRPIGFVFHDIESYRNSRGLVFENPFDYMPGDKILSFEELISFIERMAEGADPFSDDRKRLMPIFHKYNDCKSTERLIKALGFIGDID